MLLILLLGFLTIVAVMAVVVSERHNRLITAAGCAVFLGLVVLSNSVLIVQDGSVAFSRFFGKVQPGFRTAGIHLVNPLLNWERDNIRNQTLDFSGEGTIQVLSRDQIPVNVDMTFNYADRPEFVGRKFVVFGPQDERQLVTPAVLAAARTCSAQQNWAELVSAAGRAAYAQCVQATTAAAVREKMLANGMTTEEVAGSYTFNGVDVRQIVPTNQRLLEAVAEKLAAEQALERQVTLTRIAKLEAERRETDGEGLARMMAALPNTFGVQDIASIAAVVNHRKIAEAVEDCVAKGAACSMTIIVDGGKSVDAAVPVGR